jgi:hypothetical protein
MTTRKSFLAVVAAGLIGAGVPPEVACASQLVLAFKGSQLNAVTIAPGTLVTVDLLLINDFDLQAGVASVGLSVPGVVEIVSASNDPPGNFAALPFSSGAPDGPTGEFGGFLPFPGLTDPLPGGGMLYDLGDITYRAVGLGTVTLAPITGPLDWLDGAGNLIMPPLILSATIEVKTGAGAGGATLDTPPLHVGAGSDPAVSFARCAITNHGDEPIFVAEAHILNQSGAVVASGVDVGVPANGARRLVHAPVEQGFCRVRGKFSKRSVQVTFCSVAGGSNDGACLEAVSAP